MTTATDDQLAAVLDEIAEMEAAPGFEGQKISDGLEHFALLFRIGELSEDHFGDHVVGEIGRACYVNRWRVGMAESYPDDALHVVVDIWIGLRCHTGRGPSRALAAATAYRNAMAELK